MILLTLGLEPRDFCDFTATLFPQVARRKSLEPKRLNGVARLSRLFLGLRACARAHASARMRVHARATVEKSRGCRGIQANPNENRVFRCATSIFKVAWRSRNSRGKLHMQSARPSDNPKVQLQICQSRFAWNQGTDRTRKSRMEIES